MVYAHHRPGDVKAFVAVEFLLTLLIIEYLFIPRSRADSPTMKPPRHPMQILTEGAMEES
jgi:hypothetical protein